MILFYSSRQRTVAVTLNYLLTLPFFLHFPQSSLGPSLIRSSLFSLYTSLSPILSLLSLFPAINSLINFFWQKKVFCFIFQPSQFHPPCIRERKEKKRPLHGFPIFFLCLSLVCTLIFFLSLVLDTHTHALDI